MRELLASVPIASYLARLFTVMLDRVKCLLLPVFLLLIVGIGFYPKLATEMYDVKTVAVNAEVRQSYTQIAQTNSQIYAKGFLTPKVVEPEVAPILGVLK